MHGLWIEEEEILHGISSSGRGLPGVPQVALGLKPGFYGKLSGTAGSN
jgi:hypothetical protein